MNDVLAAGSSTRAYFREWAQAIEQDEASLIVPPPMQLIPLMTVRAFEDPTSPDASHLAAAQIAEAPAFNANLDKFIESETSAKSQLGMIRDQLGEIREKLRKHKDVVSRLLEAQLGPPRELDTKIASYLLVGSAKTRLGEDIALPGKNVEDRPLQTLLGLFRIIGEHEFDDMFGLPWLAGDESEEAKRFVTWETRAGAAGEAVGSAMGRAVAVTVTGILGTLIKLPDELTIGMSYVAGIAARKGAERHMHRILLERPDIG